jgi:YqcI/YcgG family
MASRSIRDFAVQVTLSIGKNRGFVAEGVAAEWGNKDADQICDWLQDKNAKSIIRNDDLSRLCANLLINTVCVAIQYNVNLVKVYRALRLKEFIAENYQEDSEIAQNLVDLRDVGRQLFRNQLELTATLAVYHGWRYKKIVEPLGSIIGAIHNLIYSIAREFKFDLNSSLDAAVARAREPKGKSSDLYAYHPATSKIGERMSPVVTNTVCVFAAPTYVWGAPVPDKAETMLEYVNRVFPILQRFTRATEQEEIDALAFMFDGKIGDNINYLASFFRCFIELLLDQDYSRSGNRDYEDSDWKFRINGMEMFVQVFAPCYTAQNTRYSHETEKVFIQFVSEAAFHRAVRREKNAWEKSRKIIRDSAAAKGQPYDIQVKEADTFIHPLVGGEPPIKWYLMAPISATRPFAMLAEDALALGSGEENMSAP